MRAHRGRSSFAVLAPPQTTIWEYPGVEDSWRLVFAEFPEDIRPDRIPAASLDDARAALEAMEKITAKTSK